MDGIKSTLCFRLKLILLPTNQDLDFEVRMEKKLLSTSIQSPVYYRLKIKITNKNI